MVKVVLGVIFLLGGFSSQSQSVSHSDPAQHQLILSFTNAVTGFTKDDPVLNVIRQNKIRYGFIGSVDYHWNLIKWFSIGTGIGLIVHRSFSTYYTNGPPPLKPYPTVPLKYYETLLTHGIVDLPLHIIFSISKTDKLEFLFRTSISYQYLLFNKKNSFSLDYLGYAQSNEYRNFFLRESGLGLAIGPIFKITKLKRLMIQPEFRLIQFTKKYFDDHINAKAYSIGLALGWIFKIR